MLEKSDIDWVCTSKKDKDVTLAKELFSTETARKARNFHSQIPGYNVTPLRALAGLARMLNVGGIYVKDEGERLELNSFKVMGGSFALYRFIQNRLNIADDQMSYEYLISKECHDKLGTITFASATDGNHGRGIAWAARKLGHHCVIYVHKDTSINRINAIKSYGAVVKIIDGNYDDAVKQIVIDAGINGWEIISDTSWDGYTEVPTWIMQGYTTMLLETQEQFAGLGITRPTHVFVQAGVGALAGAVVGFYAALFPENPPKFVVVEPDNAGCLYYSAKIGDGEPHNVNGDLDTIMAGLACGDPSPIAWKILWPLADMFMQVPDYIAARGMRILATPLHDDALVISGESGAVTLGALYSLMTEDSCSDARALLEINKNSQILFINTEGNTDPTLFRQIIWDGSNPVPKKYFTQR